VECDGRLNITGTIDYVDPSYTGALSGPISGLLVADGVTGVGVENIALDVPPSSLTLNFGSFSINETNEDFYGSGLPLAYFSNGAVTGLDFYMTDAEPGFDLWIAGGMEFVLFDNLEMLDMVTGTLNFTPVPLPSALCLLASGLFVLLRIRPKSASA
jgi:hypothetical protein